MDAVRLWCSCGAGEEEGELEEVEGRLDGRALCLLSVDLEESEKETL